MKLLISFPQIVIEHKEVEVTPEQAEELLQHSNISERAGFIWSNMTDKEQQWTPNGIRSVESAIDLGYCSIKEKKA